VSEAKRAEELVREVALIICKLRGWSLGSDERRWGKGERDAYRSALSLQDTYHRLYRLLSRRFSDAEFIATEIFEQSLYDWDPESRRYNVGSSIAGRDL
tara:strand:- start:4117 stop:4413 length:297 start_codon:yes stop_codon:yes gene_type:complete